MSVRSATAPADGDRDGMPDAWERAHGLNPANAADRNGYNLDSAARNYTNLEVYLNSLVDEHPSASMSATREISVELSNKCLDVRAAETDDGARVIQYRCSGRSNQSFYLLPFGDGSYTIVAEHSGKCLDILGSSRASGAAAHQWTCYGGSSQRWYVDSDAGVTRLRNMNSNKCLEVAGASSADGAALQQGDCDDGGNQRFRFSE